MKIPVLALIGALIRSPSAWANEEHQLEGMETSHHMRGVRNGYEVEPLDNIHINNERTQHRGTKGVVSRLAKSSKSTKSTSFPKCVNDNYVSTWLTVVNNNNSIPDTEVYGGKYFGSYNAPSVNSFGLVVFRARSVGGGNEGGGGGEAEISGRRRLAETGHGPSTGVFVRDMSEDGMAAGSNIIRQAGRRTTVPQPNNLDTLFVEFPSFPRISTTNNYIATRGNHGPVWEYEIVGRRLRQLQDEEVSTTRVGNTGIYVNLSPLTADINGDATTLFTACSKLGAVGFDSTYNVDFTQMYQVPGLTNTDGSELRGVVFDVFPGAPSTDDYGNVATKGNYPKGNVSQTGVFYRNAAHVEGSSIVKLNEGLGTLYVVANSETNIPAPKSKTSTKTCDGYTFGSTAPPSIANGKMVFLGLDNEDNPQCGGIYLANMDSKNYPKLTPLVDLETKVPGQDDALFSKLGDVLSFDGSAVSFWGSWGDEVKEVTLCCPTSGNKDLRDYCSHLGDYDPTTGLQTGDPNTITDQTIDDCPPLDDGFSRYQVKTVPVNQGFFVYDRNQIKTVVTIEADKYNDLLYWVYSGKPPAMGPSARSRPLRRNLDEDEDSEAAEPPRWRSGAFAALSSKDDVMFKQTNDGVTGIWHWDGKAATPIVKVGDHCSTVDNSTDAAMIIDSVSIERDSYRASQLAIAAACSVDAIDEEDEEDSDWGGIYLRKFCPPQ
eukprot:CCRYP_001267-RD/>CCRYP_001267-RD protein AED:0.03 eAED:0.03 QI:6222/1/1/1/0.63/0.58/12/127/714